MTMFSRLLYQLQFHERKIKTKIGFFMAAKVRVVGKVSYQVLKYEIFYMKYTAVVL